MPSRTAFPLDLQNPIDYLGMIVLKKKKRTTAAWHQAPKLWQWPEAMQID